MADLRKFASTSNIVRFMLKHATTGQGLTGLSSTSSGLIISTICDNESECVPYAVAASNVQGITTVGTYEAPSSGKCRFQQIDSTNHPGLYEFQFADARFAVANSKRLVISVQGATNLLNAVYEIEFTGIADAPLTLGTNTGGLLMPAWRMNRRAASNDMFPASR